MSTSPFANVVFDEATPDQRKRTWEDNGAVWAGPLTLKEYIARESTLAQTPQCQDGNCRYWVLYHRDDPLDIISSCETHRKKIFVRPRRGAGGETKELDAYSVASVHTHPKYRARGMAGYLLGNVLDFLDARVQWSFLYSDIGRQYYAQMGWNMFRAEQMTMSVIEPGFVVPERVKLVRGAGPDVRELCERDAVALRARITALPEDGKTHVAMVPTYEQISWQHTSANFSAVHIAGRPVANVGAVVSSGESWVLWYHDFHERELKIQRVVALDEAKAVDDIRDLFEAACVEAGAWGFKDVVAWGPGETVTLGAKALANGPRGYVKLVWNDRLEYSLPSLRWTDDADAGEVVWHESEYYSWC
ncbi:hypothetical protein jhhlp_003758 [Lomentospora prolificans]|uniref:LYC1 C-terminal domain-containing protein n=1 Tax=Lomentospora prolificans TaxID=41688 RepID=A0A2N3N9Q5_9PEZI|nr:hypothetical protein jhhlp_003758 [Lomentospora prolificans]